jgi:hypothetical protein
MSINTREAIRPSFARTERTSTIHPLEAPSTSPTSATLIEFLCPIPWSRMPNPDPFHDLFLPALAGLVLTGLKIMSDRKNVSFDEFNGIALDLILVTIGASALFMEGRPPTAYQSFGVVTAALAVILLLLRYRRSGEAARLPVGVPLQETRWWFAFLQLFLGVAAFIWLFKAE